MLMFPLCFSYCCMFVTPGRPPPRSEPLVTGSGRSGGIGVRGVDRVGVRGGWPGNPLGGRTGIASRGSQHGRVGVLGGRTVRYAPGVRTTFL